MQKTKMLRPGDPIEFTADELLQKKIENVLDGVEWTVKHLLSELKDANLRMVVDFINDLAVNENPRPNTKRAYITNLVLLSRYFEHKKTLKEFTKDEILTYLQSYRRTPAADPKERWINTYNSKTMLLSKFFKWLYFPQLDKAARKKAKPEVVKDLPIFKKKEKSTVEAKDLWLPEEDRIFLRYCPDIRLQLYHTMSDDTSGRPHELLNRRFNDVKIKQYEGRTYGEVEIGRGGKTKGRTVPLINSIPYFKQWQAQNDDPNRFIFRARSQHALYKNRPMTVQALGRLYRVMKEHFRTLLNRPDIPPEDKLTIKNILEKPWNPYIRRHTSLTEKARLLPNDYSLRLHAGWTKNSKMVDIYTHELGGESSAELLAAYGVMPKTINGKMDLLKPRTCPNCGEPNKPDARFCVNVPKCGLPLTFDAYKEQKEKEKEKEEEIKKLRADTDIKITAVKEEFKDILQAFIMKYALRDAGTDDPRFFESLLTGSEKVRKDGRFDAMLERVKADITARKEALEQAKEKGITLPEVKVKGSKQNGVYPAMSLLPKKLSKEDKTEDA